MQAARCGSLMSASSGTCALPSGHDGECSARAFLFVGECRSLTAKRMNWTWKDGRLAAKPLFEALRAMGVDPAQHDYINLWTDSTPPVVPWQRVQRLKAHATDGGVIVALGKRVSDELKARQIEQVALVHPAARGAIRKRERYVAHVAERLRS